MKTIALIISFLAATQSFAHGGDQPGPHGGEIQMPGAFHTELVFNKVSKEATIFLLDIDFKNPTLKNSSVKAFFQSGKIKVDYSCLEVETHFSCTPQKKITAKTGELHINATRENAKGNEVVYKLK